MECIEYHIEIDGDEFPCEFCKCNYENESNSAYWENYDTHKDCPGKIQSHVQIEGGKG